MSAQDTRVPIGWFPARGTWEESVLSWNEQIDSALRNSRGTGLREREREQELGAKFSQEREEPSVVG